MSILISEVIERILTCPQFVSIFRLNWKLLNIEQKKWIILYSNVQVISFNYFWNSIKKFNFSEEFSDKYLVWSSLLVLVIIFSFYLFFVLSAGPKFMAKKEPYELKQFIRCYNCFQVVVCTFFVAGGLHSFAPKFLFKCESFSFLKNEEKWKVFIGIWLFLGLRVLEFLETVFFVLRKKHRQASFLHIYHHIGSAFMVWLFIAMNAGEFEKILNSQTKHNFHFRVNGSLHRNSQFFRSYCDVFLLLFLILREPDNIFSLSTFKTFHNSHSTCTVCDYNCSMHNRSG